MINELGNFRLIDGLRSDLFQQKSCLKVDAALDPGTEHRTLIYIMGGPSLFGFFSF